MRLRDNPQLHLTYCLNIHPGETWDENFAAIRDNATKVRDAIAKNREPFGLGLRLSNIAARSLVEKTPLEAFRKFLAEQNMYVFTINGFPYGTFHGKPVKQAVYQPDWRTSERRDYTNILSDILAALLPDGVPGSISTVPGSYKEWIKNEGDITLMAENLLHCATHLAEIEKKTGKHISVALEPEPDCFLETTEDVLSFFKKHVPSRILPYLGICFDTCHLAVQFENLEASLKKLQGQGIAIPKVQLSAAVKTRVDDSSLRELAKFCDPVYLHQVRAMSRLQESRRQRIAALQSIENVTLSEILEGRIGAAAPRADPGGRDRQRSGNPLRPSDDELLQDAAAPCPVRLQRVARYKDLSPDLLSELASARGSELRAHFHVPLYVAAPGGLDSTASDLTPEFFRAVLDSGIPHLEIETYTFDVLPPALRATGVTASIAQEYEWVMRKLQI